MQIIVLGMHRSGSSMLTRLLNMMGAYFGQEGSATDPNEENPKGFWERRDLRTINDAILQGAGFDWHRTAGFSMNKVSEALSEQQKTPISRLMLDLDAHRPWVIKEPRLCLTLDAFRPYLEVPVCVVMYRKPIQLAQSLKKRNGFPIPFSIALWEKYMRSALCAAADLPTVLVSHSELTDDPVTAVATLHQDLLKAGVTGLHLPKSTEIEAFVDTSLYRNKGTDRLQSQYLNADQRRLVERFEDRSVLTARIAARLSAGARELLELYEQQLDQALRINDQSDEVGAIEIRLEASRLQTAKAQAECQRIEESRVSLARERTELVAKLNDTRADEDHLRQQLAEEKRDHIARLDQAAKKAEQLEAELHSVSATKSELVSKLTMERERNSTLGSRIDELSEALQLAEKRKTKSASEIAEQAALLSRQQVLADEQSARLAQEAASRDKLLAQLEEARKREIEVQKLHADNSARDAEEIKHLKTIVEDNQVKQIRISKTQHKQSSTARLDDRKRLERLMINIRELSRNTAPEMRSQSDYQALESRLDAAESERLNAARAAQISTQAAAKGQWILDQLKSEMTRFHRELDGASNDLEDLVSQDLAAHLESLRSDVSLLFDSYGWRVARRVAGLSDLVRFRRPQPGVSQHLRLLMDGLTRLHADASARISDLSAGKMNEVFDRIENHLRIADEAMDAGSQAFVGSGLDTVPSICLVVIHRRSDAALDQFVRDYLSAGYNHISEFTIVDIRTDSPKSRNTQALLRRAGAKIRRPSALMDHRALINESVMQSNAELVLLTTTETGWRGDLPGELFKTYRKTRPAVLATIGAATTDQRSGNRILPTQYDFRFAAVGNTITPVAWPDKTHHQPLALASKCMLLSRSDFVASGGLRHHLSLAGTFLELTLRVSRLRGRPNAILPGLVLSDRGQPLQPPREESAALSPTLSRSIRRLAISRVTAPGYRPSVALLVANRSTSANYPELACAIAMADAMAGDTAFGHVAVLSVKSDSELAGFDLILSLTPSFNVATARTVNRGIRVAWVCHNPELWLSQLDLSHYELVFAATTEIQQALLDRHQLNSHILSPGYRKNVAKTATPACPQDYLIVGRYSMARPSVIDQSSEAFTRWRGIAIGPGWEDHPQLASVAKGDIPWHGLPSVDQSAHVVVWELSDELLRWPWVPGWVYEAILAGSLVISNSAKVSERVFDGSMPVFTSAAELTELLDRFCGDELERALAVLEQQKKAQPASMRERALALRSTIRDQCKDAMRWSIKVEASDKQARLAAGKLADLLSAAGQLVRVDGTAYWYRPVASLDEVVIIAGSDIGFEHRSDQFNLIWQVDCAPEENVEINDESYVFADLDMRSDSECPIPDGALSVTYLIDHAKQNLQPS